MAAMDHPAEPSELREPDLISMREHQAPSIRPSEVDDDEEPLLGGRRRPVFQLSVAPVAMLRVAVLAIALADFAHMVQHNRVEEAFGAIFVMCLIIWTLLVFTFSSWNLMSRLRGEGDTPLQLELGPITCIIGRKRDGGSPRSTKRNYAIILVDLIFGLLMLLPIISTRLEGPWWRYRHYSVIVGTSSAIL